MLGVQSNVNPGQHCKLQTAFKGSRGAITWPYSSFDMLAKRSPLLPQLELSVISYTSPTIDVHSWSTCCLDMSPLISMTRWARITRLSIKFSCHAPTINHCKGEWMEESRHWIVFQKFLSRTAQTWTISANASWSKVWPLNPGWPHLRAMI